MTLMDKLKENLVVRNTLVDLGVIVAILIIMYIA